MSELISTLEGNTFVVCDKTGNMLGSPTEPTGLFDDDTRFLSRWHLTVNGQVPRALSTDDLQYFATQFFLAPASGTIYEDSTVSVIRRRAVGKGFHEDLTIVNHGAEPAELTVRIDVDADFADLFEVKDKLEKKGRLYRKHDGGRIVLGYQREGYKRETWITSSEPARLDDAGLEYKMTLPGHGQWTTCLDVITADVTLGSDRAPIARGHGDLLVKPELGGTLDEWIEAAPKLSSGWRPLERIYHRSLVDLAALRFFTDLVPGMAVPAAGLPWFMTVFGRDSILTSYQALPFVPRMAADTLRMLAAMQGRSINDFRDEEPGKIMHEFRFGELTAFEERPQSPYYGSSDVTALFLILLDEYERWSGDRTMVTDMERTARAALQWIDNHGDRDGDGYVEYARKLPSGLINQCWKDSTNSIVFHDGTIAELPRATCEIQGYVYDARRRAARLAREIWKDQALADKLERQAADLKRRFNEDFWIDDRRFFALALDGKKRKVDSLTSNIGHLLWSGIVDEDKAAPIVRHLLSDAMFTGWGVRTMASSEGAYNPIGYHVGTVWPFDCSFIAMGLRRYGCDSEAAQIAQGILDAACYFDYRLPEAFAGYARTSTRYPVEYPTACSPQAWSTGAPLLMIRALLGLEPVGEHLVVEPGVPSKMGRIELLGVPGRWGRADAFARGLLDVTDEKVADIV